MPKQDPHQEYTRRHEARRAEAMRHRRRAKWISNLRLAVFGFGIALGWVVWEAEKVSPWWMVPLLGLFGLLMVAHDRILRSARRAYRAQALYESGLARLEERWAGSGNSGLQFLDDSHSYARDLDLFGAGSLFELLCSTRTVWGAKTLAKWLLTPAPVDVIRERQAAVDELRPRLELREEIAVLDEDITSNVDPEALIRWASSPPILSSRWVPVAAFALGVAAVVLTALYLASLDLVGRLPVLLVLGAEACLAMWWRPRVREVIFSVERPGRELGLLAKLLYRLENEPFQSPRLIELQGSLETKGVAASKQIARLSRRIDMLDARRNQLFAPLAALLLWGTQFAFALERWRRNSGATVEKLLASMGEMEALLSLATYSYEHPADPFPKLVDKGPLFEGEGLGHPLLPEKRSVRNDVHLGDGMRLLVVSGSNMSGKSTLLRTVGTNSVLALCGAPVRAGSLRLSPLAVGASIRILDSLQEGVSRFYAEIKRLRQIMDMSNGPPPLVFLLDEILHGTNSHDRRIGAEAVVRRLVERGAVGLMTTHDLALSRVAEGLSPSAANVHFEDHLEDGKMVFDYRLRSGVVRKSNALDLMRSIGLEV